MMATASYSHSEAAQSLVQNAYWDDLQQYYHAQLGAANQNSQDLVDRALYSAHYGDYFFTYAGRVATAPQPSATIDGRRVNDRDTLLATAQQGLLEATNTLVGILGHKPSAEQSRPINTYYGHVQNLLGKLAVAEVVGKTAPTLTRADRRLLLSSRKSSIAAHKTLLRGDSIQQLMDSALDAGRAAAMAGGFGRLRRTVAAYGRVAWSVAWAMDRDLGGLLHLHLPHSTPQTIAMMWHRRFTFLSAKAARNSATTAI